MTWERVQPDCVDLIIQCADSEMPIYGSDYQNRVHCISESSILLWDVTASDYGMYRFSYDMTQHQYKNSAGQDSANANQSPTATDDPIYVNCKQIMQN
ncbi:hypothetical protein E2320_011297 [Naja naja]|nr:hypothetical protein E2320_011297 [Naja naja]